MNEKEVMLLLSKWLEDYNFEVFWNMKNDFGYNVFKVGGDLKRPDLYIRQKDKPFLFNCVIEAKNASHDKNILRGSKIIDYHNEYVDGTAKYYSDGVTLQPKYFLLATQFSPEGKLYDENILLEAVGDGTHRRALAEKYPHFLPKNEFIRTGDSIRSLWENWKNRKPPATVGVLLSSVLDNDGGTLTTQRPAIQCLRYKNGWKQVWLIMV